MKKRTEGAADIVIYFEDGGRTIPGSRLSSTFASTCCGAGGDVTRIREYICPECNTPVEDRKALQMRVAKWLRDIGCSACDFRIQLRDLIEEKVASDEFREKVRKLDERAGINIDSESRQLILVGHAMAIAGEAGQMFRPVDIAKWGHPLDEGAEGRGAPECFFRGKLQASNLQKMRNRVIPFPNRRA